MKVATIVLNRNLPDQVDDLCKKFLENYIQKSDIYVLEAGSDDNRISKFTSWHVKDAFTRKNGMRFSRGVNYAIKNLILDQKFYEYDYFFFMTNDTEICSQYWKEKIFELFGDHSRLGILIPCATNWGEYLMIKDSSLKYIWHADCGALILKKEFILDLINPDEEYFDSYFLDGKNFRGYLSIDELIVKAYNMNWGVGLTPQILVEENEEYLLNSWELIKTEPYEENKKLYIEEGLKWLKTKYGFNNRWSMMIYCRDAYERFMEFNKELMEFKL